MIFAALIAIAHLLGYDPDEHFDALTTAVVVLIGICALGSIGIAVWAGLT